MKRMATLFLTVFLAVITLTWDAPTTNEDGSPLTDLGGYKLYCGPRAGFTTNGGYTVTKDVGDVLTYPISNDLTDGNWHCAATVYDTSGNESVFSNEVTFPLDRVRPGAPINLRVI